MKRSVLEIQAFTLFVESLDSSNSDFENQVDAFLYSMPFYDDIVLADIILQFLLGNTEPIMLSDLIQAEIDMINSDQLFCFSSN